MSDLMGIQAGQAGETARAEASGQRDEPRLFRDILQRARAEALQDAERLVLPASGPEGGAMDPSRRDARRGASRPS